MGHDGRAVAAIGVHAQPHQIDPRRIPEHAASVLDAAARVTARIHGRTPKVTTAGEHGRGTGRDPS